MSVDAACHCSAVRLTLAAAPETVTDCDCSICRRYGVLWAYNSLRDVVVVAGAATDTYAWNDHALDFHRCVTCGCATHRAARDPALDGIGINARLLGPAMLARARINGWMAR